MKGVWCYGPVSLLQKKTKHTLDIIPQTLLRCTLASSAGAIVFLTYGNVGIVRMTVED